MVVEEQKTNLLSLAILFHFLCDQHVSEINISIIRSLRLFCWITYHIDRIVLGSMCVGVSVWLGWRGIRVAGFSLQHGYHSNPTTPKLQQTSNQEQYDQCGNSTQ